MAKLKKRKDGRYQVQVYIGRGDDGKSKYRTVYGATPAECDNKAKELKYKVGKGINVQAGKDTFSTWCTRWLGVKKTNVGAKHYQTCKSCINPMLESLGNIPLPKILPIHIQWVIDDLSAKGRAKSTLDKVKSYTAQIFKMAMINRVIDFDPTIAVNVPEKAPVSHRKAITEAQQAWITDTPHNAKCAAMIMLYAGLRRGELIPLRWHDVDLAARTITVNKSVEFAGNTGEVKDGAKTDAGRRTIDIPALLVEFLTSEKAKSESEEKLKEKVVDMSRLVCPSPSGKMHTGTTWRNMWKSYMYAFNLKYGYNGKRPKQKRERKKDSGDQEKKKPKKHYTTLPVVIDTFTPHQLRHTYATMLYHAGVDMLSAKEQLGHTDIKTTLGIYTHLDRQYKRHSILMLDNYLAQAGNADKINSAVSEKTNI